MSEEESKKYSAKENMMKLKMMKSSTIQRTAKKMNYRRIQIYTNLKWERGYLNLGQMILIFLLNKTENQPLLIYN